MEHSKPNLDTSDSQIPGSSCSLSIPSEPPDLGNWFGSYMYESPIIISDYDTDTRKSEREKEEGDSYGFRSHGTKVEVLIQKKHNSNKVVKCGSFSRNQCLDKVSDSSELTSSLSEPKDIKNWFSSYVYESPLLDTTDGVGDSLCKESKSEKDESVKCDSSWRCTKQAMGPVSEVPGPLVSPSLLSGLIEPTDIRNWYSSYVYESPPLDTIDGFSENVSKESKSQKGRFIIEDIKRDNDEDFQNSSEERIVSEGVVVEKELPKGLSNRDSSRRDSMQEMQFVSKVPGSLSSSLLSEPTDIRNWFSSYVYESPSLGTADGFEDSVCKVSKYEKGEVLVENSDRHKEEADVEEFSKSRKDSQEFDVGMVQSEEPAKYNTSCRHSKQERQPGGLNTEVDEGLSGQNDLCLGYMPKALQNHIISQAKEDDTSSYNKAVSQSKLDQDISYGTRFKPSTNQRISYSIDGNCVQNLTQSRGSTLQESSEATVHTEHCLLLKSDSESAPAHGESVAKSTHGSKEREYDGKGVSENGFVTTRKRKFTGKNNENSPRGPQESCKGSVSLVDGKEVVARRKALADTTNFHHSTPTLITGKWQCPQKRKPNLGPPLKQLGLEQWIRKL